MRPVFLSSLDEYIQFGLLELRSQDAFEKCPAVSMDHVPSSFLDILYRPITYLCDIELSEGFMTMSGLTAFVAYVGHVYILWHPNGFV